MILEKKFDKDITFEEWTEAIQNYNDEFDLQSTPYRLLNLYEELRRMNYPKFKVGGHTFLWLNIFILFFNFLQFILLSN